MEDVDKLSDAQIRAKLMEFGFPVMPITGTTRKVMAKKLRILLENRNKAAGKDNRRSLGRFSSDDDSDVDVKPGKKTEKSRRATMAAPIMQPPSSKVATKRSTRNDSLSSSESSAPKEIKQVKTTTTTRTTKILETASGGVHDEYDTGSESDEISENFPNFPSTSRKTIIDDHNTKKYSPIIKKSYELNPELPSTSSSSSTCDRLSQVRSRLTLPTSPFLSGNYHRPLYTSSPAIVKDDNDDDDDDGDTGTGRTPFLSNFTKRLSQIRENPKINNTSSYDYKSEIIKENDVNNGGNGGGFSAATNLLNSYRSRVGRYSTYDYKTNQQQQQQQQNGFYGFKNNNLLKDNYISVMVLVVAFLFFMFLAIIYLGIRSDTALETAAIIPLCKRNDVNAIPYVNCIQDDDKENAFSLLKAILMELENRTILNKCENTLNDRKSFMTESDIVDFIRTTYGIQNKEQILSDLINVELLTILNPHWGIDLLQFNNGQDEKILTKMDDKEVTKTTALILRNPKVPWNCYLYKKFQLYSI